MIINYFYKQCFKFKLNPLRSKKSFFEETILSTINVILKGGQLLNARLLFLSLSNFCVWIRFLAEQQLYLWLIFADKSLLTTLFKQRNFGIIIEKAWIPGLLSNSYVVCNGERYAINNVQRNFETTRKLDFAFFSSIKKRIVFQEINNQLIPQFTMIWWMTNIWSNSFIPLFIPKFKQQNFICQRFLFNLNNVGSLSSHFIFKSGLNQRYLIYLFFLFLIYQ